jgi:hypothetical protein
MHIGSNFLIKVVRSSSKEVVIEGARFMALYVGSVVITGILYFLLIEPTALV